MTEITGVSEDGMTYWTVTQGDYDALLAENQRIQADLDRTTTAGNRIEQQLVEAASVMTKLRAENQRLCDALEVGLLCMCDSCVERNKALLGFGTEGVPELASGKGARSASADVRVAGSSPDEVGADGEALAGEAE